MHLRRPALVCSLGLLFACQTAEPAEPAPAPTVVAPTGAAEPAAAAPAAAAPAPTAPAALLDPPDPNEACARILLQAYKGAELAPDTVTRSKDEARSGAERLLGELRAGAALDALARQHSDAPSSAPRGGILGTFGRDEWPEVHNALKEPLFALKVNELAAQPIEAPYGFVLLQRCPVEKAHGRHILVRYQGAKRAEPSVTRSKAQARAEAEQLLQQLTAGADFAKLAGERSEDGSAKRGGDIGSPGRGRLAQPFEEALFGMQPGQRSGVVETEFGFHLIERLPDEPNPQK
jgi:hypothetical protein